jgi:glycosyltransferase involved in cell wall biosynthesis
MNSYIDKKTENSALKMEKIKFRTEAKIIKKTKNFTPSEIIVFIGLLDSYFKKGRPSYFAEFEKIMTPRFSEVVKIIPADALTSFTNQYHQFAKTVKPEDFNDSRQKQISREILKPFLFRIKSIQKNNPIPELPYEINPKNILILTRHATTEGIYAPGKLILSVAKSFLNMGKNVQVVTIGLIGKSFTKLMKENSNFHVKKLKSNGSNDLNALSETCDLLKEFKPAAIFTEIEISILVKIEECNLPSPIFLISAGFYRVPWYSGVLVTQELQKQISNRKMDRPIFSIPTTHLPEQLAPYCDPVILEKTRSELDISNKFVIATFSRFEKMSKEFLNLISDILDQVPNSVCILAGPGDKGRAEEVLSNLVVSGRVKLLGVSDISVLGYSCDVFLETFPECVGYAALESMAKGKPVFSINCPLLEFYRVSRVESLIFDTERQLIASLSRAAKDRSYYNEISIESKAFVESNFYSLKKLSDALKAVIDYPFQ